MDWHSRLTHHVPRARLLGRCAALAVSVLALAGCASQPLIRDRFVVVMDFDNTLTDPKYKDLSRSLAEMMTAALINSPRVAVVERQDIRDIFARGAHSPERWYDIGRDAGVDYVIAGSISRLEENFILNARLLSVTTGRIIKGSSVERFCRREEDLYPVIQAMSGVMAYDIRVLAERFDALATEGRPAPEANP